MPVAETRANLSAVLRDFRANGADAEPVVIGSHRKPEAVLIPYRRYVATARTETSDTLVDVRTLLHRRRSLIERLAQTNRISSVELFGSVARGEDGPESDIDLLVVPDDGASLFDLARFESDMEELFGRKVDVVSRRGLDPERHRGILNDAQPL
ncbi:nucleotidyltransferase domain-containing protein [Agromyces mangrovi Wang et al. 2018]|uniref:nucleotidyltransferase domain-containing protein n=1 Tax=Agromyces mangrovi TaxID=1858653 RepID=UPI0025733614|nr:nucleotidyltransferase domain-containing protein [Agromyces mangrovi]BDZ64125.1 hypothetical protein GCM10025877_10630 [Agromyces mangrovi]